MFSWRKVLRVVLGLLALVGLTIFAIAILRARVELHGPHLVQRSAARFDAPLEAAIKYQIEADKPQTVEEIIRFSLRVTGDRLRFGLGHSVRLSFSVEERRANCIEYAHLFARIFDLAALRAKVSAKAYVVHSTRAQIYGKTIPLPGFRDHDWVAIVDDTEKPSRQWFVDPSFDDAWLSWELEHNVRGEVRIYK